MEAIHYIKKTLDLDKENVDYWFTYAEIHEKIGFIEEAEIAYKKVIELENFEPEIWLNYSNLLYQQEYQKEAIDVLCEGIKYHPDSADIFYRLSAYLFNQGDDNKALTYFQDALKLNYEKHQDIFIYMPNVKDNPNLINLLNTYKK